MNTEQNTNTINPELRAELHERTARAITEAILMAGADALHRTGEEKTALDKLRKAIDKAIDEA